MDASQPSERIQKTLAQIGITDVEVTVARPSLEDVFVALTKRYSTNGKSV
jgi:hypothetical protein